jgi:CMP/dCMP kinase
VTRRGDDEDVITIAIDGPAGAGKSTIAREVARALGARYLDTGALYRAVALACIQRGVAPEDAAAAAEVARSIDIDLEAESVLLDGNDVTRRIRDADVTESVSVVAQHAGVRAVLLERQREMARTNDLVAEGRDMATVVFPDAGLKIYLTASLEERARRRALELGLDGGEAEALREAIAKRDEADSSRDESPLTKAPDAEEIDTTGMSREEVVRRIVELVGERR